MKQGWGISEGTFIVVSGKRHFAHHVSFDAARFGNVALGWGLKTHMP
jgi:hypothetical protein